MSYNSYTNLDYPDYNQNMLAYDMQEPMKEQSSYYGMPMPKMPNVSIKDSFVPLGGKNVEMMKMPNMFGLSNKKNVESMRKKMTRNDAGKKKNDTMMWIIASAVLLLIIIIIIFMKMKKRNSLGF